MMRKHLLKIGRIAAAALLPAAVVITAMAATRRVVTVDLLDSTSNPAMSGMQIKPTLAKVKAGDVVFQVTNRSSALVHEMLIVRLNKAGQALPYNAKDDKLDEDAITSLGEVSELEPGQGGALTVTLAAGVYALLCNQPGHFHAGMTTTLTVTP